MIDRIDRVFCRHPSQFREIAVHPRIQTTDGSVYDVLFVGTDRGQVLKLVVPVDRGPTKDQGSVEDGSVVLVEELQVVPKGDPVLGLQVGKTYFCGILF